MTPIIDTIHGTMSMTRDVISSLSDLVSLSITDEERRELAALRERAENLLDTQEQAIEALRESQG